MPVKVLFIITNINGFHEIPYSFGLCSIASYIENRGHSAKILSICNENEYNKLTEEIYIFNPQVIGFTTVSSQFTHVKDISKLIKNINKHIFIVCGGIHPTLYPDALLESAAIDGFFVGESEIAFGDFLDKLRGDKDYRNTSNFVYKKDGEIIRNALMPLIQNLDILPYPAKDSLFEKFIVANGCAPFFFSRGCPYSCSYCSNHALANMYGFSMNKPRYRPISYCIEEIKDALKMYKFKAIWIMDDIFGLDRKWRKEFCKQYKKEVNIKFICNLRVNIFDEEFAKLLKDAGCYKIFFGVESGNEYVRNTIMKRNISTEQIIPAFNLCRKYRLESTALNIIGVPGETEEMIWDTIKLNKKIRPNNSAVNIFYPYKGTVLGDFCFSKNLVDEKMYNDFSNERRGSVLNYPEIYKDKIHYYYKNWAILTDPYNVKKRISAFKQDYILKIKKDYKLIYGISKKIRILLATLKNKCVNK